MVETIVAVGVSGFVLIGVLGTSVMLARSSARLQSYAEMDTQVRRALDTLSADLRTATNVTLNGSGDLTVTVPLSDGTSNTYTYARSSSDGLFYRVPGSSSSATSGRVTLVKGTTSVTFSRLDSSGNATSSDATTKRIRIALALSRGAGSPAYARAECATVVVLRNKAT